MAASTKSRQTQDTLSKNTTPHNTRDRRKSSQEPSTTEHWVMKSLLHLWLSIALAILVIFTITAAAFYYKSAPIPWTQMSTVTCYFQCCSSFMSTAGLCFSESNIWYINSKWWKLHFLHWQLWYLHLQCVTCSKILYCFSLLVVLGLQPQLRIMNQWHLFV